MGYAEDSGARSSPISALSEDVLHSREPFSMFRGTTPHLDTGESLPSLPSWSSKRDLRVKSEGSLSGRSVESDRTFNVNARSRHHRTHYLDDSRARRAVARTAYSAGCLPILEPTEVYERDANCESSINLNNIVLDDFDNVSEQHPREF